MFYRYVLYVSLLLLCFACHDVKTDKQENVIRDSIVVEADSFRVPTHHYYLADVPTEMVAEWILKIVFAFLITS